MKRIVFSVLMILALTTGATYAQSTINTTAPGPTQQQEPGQTNNNLPNPGHPVQLGPNAQPPVQEQGTVEGTAAESVTGTQGANTTGNVTGTMPETETGSGVDVDVDTGSRANGAVDVDVNRTTDADTDASGINETGESTDSLPSTGSALPLVGLIGLLAFAAAFAVRRF